MVPSRALSLCLLLYLHSTSFLSHWKYRDYHQIMQVSHDEIISLVICSTRVESRSVRMTALYVKGRLAKYFLVRDEVTEYVQGKGQAERTTMPLIRQVFQTLVPNEACKWLFRFETRLSHDTSR
jgi:hypothetical protein